ncbi:MAG: hypothetical protein E6G34_14795 [Actinobacteria bacterium]|nr:MAG: hypothetical protein E6G34_14795 [Actinomycetota bacterium]
MGQKPQFASWLYTNRRFVESDSLFAEWLPDSERSQIPGAGHFFPIENSERAADTLATFFARHPMS